MRACDSSQFQILRSEIASKDQTLDNVSQQRQQLVEELEMALKRLSEKDEQILHLTAMLVKTNIPLLCLVVACLQDRVGACCRSNGESVEERRADATQQVCVTKQRFCQRENDMHCSEHLFHINRPA